MFILKSKPKIFCIGSNKTGTTSLKKFFKDHNFVVGNQPEAELLIDHYMQRNWKPIIAYCKSAQIFQDIPFSCPYTFIALDIAYPKSKFILSVRDSAEEWYHSLTKFHTKLFGKDGQLPTKEDLQNAEYRYKGFMWKTNRANYPSPEKDIYNKEILMRQYEKHNKSVIDYFKFRDDLLVVNLKEKDVVSKIADFISFKPLYGEIPWENKTII